MQDLDKQLEGMKQNVMGVQTWDEDSTSYFQASGDDVYDYADGIDPYSYAGGENVQKWFDNVNKFVTENKETIKNVGGVVGGLASAGAGGTKPCKGLFGGKWKRALGRCQDAPEPVAYVAPEKSNTGLYIGIGAGVLVIGVITFLLIRKK
jgi:hypothetical protein